MLGARRMFSGQDQRLPVTLTLLHSFVRSIYYLYTRRYERVMYTTMVLLGFHAFLRLGDYTTRGEGTNHAITMNNVKFSFKKKYLHFLCESLDEPLHLP